jgi:hypothetical protein
MQVNCPFNSGYYASGLSHLGAPEAHPSWSFCLLRRPIKDTGLEDGIGPWPYVCIADSADLTALREDFRHLVTLSVVTQPGYVPADKAVDATLLKQHFVYDPQRPMPELSRRARIRLRRAEAIGSVELITDIEDRMAMTEIYEGLKRRRGLAGGIFDYPRRHFETVARMPNSLFLQVRAASGIGAMACGFIFGDMLQILHTVIAEDGLRWNASYLLMRALQELARERGVRLLTGGMPAGGSAGLRVFKLRWVNDFTPVYLLRIVNDPRAYASLCRAGTDRNSFFPAYRAQP